MNKKKNRMCNGKVGYHSIYCFLRIMLNGAFPVSGYELRAMNDEPSLNTKAQKHKELGIHFMGLWFVALNLLACYLFSFYPLTYYLLSFYRLAGSYPFLLKVLETNVPNLPTG